jgi:hypothetical protein
MPSPHRGDSTSLDLTLTNYGVLSTHTSCLIHISHPESQLLMHTPHQGTLFCPAILIAATLLPQLESALMILLVLPTGSTTVGNLGSTHWIARQSTPADILRSIWPMLLGVTTTLSLCTSTLSPPGRDIIRRALKLIVFWKRGSLPSHDCTPSQMRLQRTGTTNSNSS